MIILGIENVTSIRVLKIVKNEMLRMIKFLLMFLFSYLILIKSMPIFINFKGARGLCAL